MRGKGEAAEQAAPKGTSPESPPTAPAYSQIVVLKRRHYSKLRGEASVMGAVKSTWGNLNLSVCAAR